MKTQKSFFEQNSGTYTQVGDVLLPNLTLEKMDSNLSANMAECGNAI